MAPSLVHNSKQMLTVLMSPGSCISGLVISTIVNNCLVSLQEDYTWE
jgi:hypothetical protein